MCRLPWQQLQEGPLHLGVMSSLDLEADLKVISNASSKDSGSNYEATIHIGFLS